MSQEAMRLACKALRDCHYYMINAGLPNQSLLNEAFTAYMELEAALAKQPAPVQQEPVECQYGKGGYACCEGGPCKADEQNNAPQPAQQEPVAVVSGYYGGQCVILPIDPARIFNSNTPLYTAPQPCPTCEALARTVMLDQTSHDAQRKPLTDEELVDVASNCGMNGLNIHGYTFARAIEAAHGIKEKNT